MLIGFLVPSQSLSVSLPPQSPSVSLPPQSQSLQPQSLSLPPQSLPVIDALTSLSSALAGCGLLDYESRTGDHLYHPPTHTQSHSHTAHTVTQSTHSHTADTAHTQSHSHTAHPQSHSPPTLALHPPTELTRSCTQSLSQCTLPEPSP